jgi:hypothetical protein
MKETMKLPFILFAMIALAFATPAYAATYCVDFASGSDTSTGIPATNCHSANNHAWQHAPGMTGCTGLCNSTTLNPADRILFKGGITWTSGAFPWTIKAVSGTSGNAIYYGTDVLWFTGGSFTRPIFDFSFVGYGTSAINFNSQSYITLDDIEVKNYAYLGAHFNDCMLNGGGSAYTNQTVSNSFFHDWHSTDAQDGAHNGAVCQDNSTGGSLVIHNMMNNTAQTSGYGACVSGADEIAFNSCTGMSQGNLDCILVHDNIFANMKGSCCGTHENVYEQVGTHPVTFYNNVYHDYPAEGLFLGAPNSNSFVYNNICWNPGSNTCVEIDTNFSPGTSIAKFYNNTWVPGGSGYALRIVQRGSGAYPTVTMENNHVISDGTPAHEALICDASWDSTDCAAVTTLTLTTNTTMTNAAAMAQGYVAGNLFAPTLSSNGTVSTGTNLTGSCSGALTQLCSDTSAGGIRTPVLRPASGAWDTGAYEYQAPTSSGSSYSGSLTTSGKVTIQ